MGCETPPCPGSMDPGWQVTKLAKLAYSGNLEHPRGASPERLTLVRGDIADPAVVQEAARDAVYAPGFTGGVAC